MVADEILRVNPTGVSGQKRHQAMIEAIEDCDTKAVVILLGATHDLKDDLRTRKTFRYLTSTVPKVATLMGK